MSKVQFSSWVFTMSMMTTNSKNVATALLMDFGIFYTVSILINSIPTVEY